MRELLETSRAVDLRDFEMADAKRIADGLQPAVAKILQEARALITAVLEGCRHLVEDERSAEGDDGIRSSYLPFELALDVTIAERLGSYQAVEEVAFVAQLELRQRQERLERANVQRGAALLLAEADSALRRVRKALSAVESAIASALGAEPFLVFATETDISLSVRRAYAKFRANLPLDDEPKRDELHARFRAAGTQIAMLVGWDVYPDLRIRDRLLLRDLQQRILTWLRNADPQHGGQADPPLGGLELWQDLVACIEMLALVSRRAELVEHDSKQMKEILSRLGSGSNVVDDETWRLLQSLEGLDRQLDLLLHTQPRPNAAQCRDVLGPLSRCTGAAGVREGVEW